MKKLLVALILLACDHDDCKTNDLRCSGQVVEICDGDRDWSEVMDCSEIYDPLERTWECCELDGGAECETGCR